MNRLSPDVARIRLASIEDVEAILAISNAAAAASPANFATEPESLATWQATWQATHEIHPWLVAVDPAHTIIGFAKSGPWKTRGAYAWTAEISVYVRPEHHGRGVGRGLYTRLFELLGAQGYRQVIGGITLPNPSSVRLHESFGMRHVGTFARNGWKFGAWHDVGYWSLELKNDHGPPGAILPVEKTLAPLRADDANGSSP